MSFLSDYTEKNSNLIPQIDIPCFAWNSQAEQGFLFFKAKSLGLTKPPETDTLKKPYMSGCHAVVMKLGLTQWKSTNRVRLGTKQH